jgi:hypothetical protein
LKRAACITMTALAMLAPGCCLPSLSGRYEQPAPQTAGLSTAHSTVQPGGCGLCAGCRHPGGGQRCEREPLFAGHDREQRRPWIEDGPGTPPGQLIPVPKFHPVPTRPVFQPQPTYLPLLPLNSLHAVPGPFESVEKPESLASPTPADPPALNDLPQPAPPRSWDPPQPKLFQPRPDADA